MKLGILERFRIGGDVYQCPKCGLLIEIKEDHQNILGFEIDGRIYGISLTAGVKRGMPLKQVRTFPTHPDCIALLLPKQIREKGKRWE
jgi:hypothetical protein